MPKASDQSLSGRKILVTGAAGGVGRAVAARMAAEGGRVLLADRNGTELQQLAALLQRGASGQVDWVSSELSTRSGIAEAFTKVDEWLGGLDLLVACVGVGSGPLMDMGDEDWRYVIEANLASYIACTRHAVERMRVTGRDDCIIILVGSISVHIKAVGESVYNASKGGIASFAETLRKEMIPERIRVTLIEPGAIGTAMQPFSPDERSVMIDQNKLLPPDEVADAIMFAATRSPGVDVVTLRIEPLDQKIY